MDFLTAAFIIILCFIFGTTAISVTAIVFGKPGVANKAIKVTGDTLSNFVRRKK